MELHALNIWENLETYFLLEIIQFKSCSENRWFISTVICFFRVCVQACLPSNIAMQLDCYGYRNHDNRHTMHVQGLSHWAPANIGPYSQAVKVRNEFISGFVFKLVVLAMLPCNWIAMAI